MSNVYSDSLRSMVSSFPPLTQVIRQLMSQSGLFKLGEHSYAEDSLLHKMLNTLVYNELTAVWGTQSPETPNGFLLWERKRLKTPAVALSVMKVFCSALPIFPLPNSFQGFSNFTKSSRSWRRNREIWPSSPENIPFPVSLHCQGPHLSISAARIGPKLWGVFSAL